MSEETDAHEGGTEAIVVHETLDAAPAVEAPVVEKADDTPAQDAGTVEAGAADDAGAEPAKPKQVPWFQKRIDELTAKRYEAEREAAYYRGLAEASNNREPEPQAGPPQEDQFANWEAFEQAKIDYAVEQRFQALEAQKQRHTVLQSYEERTAKFRESKPDFDSVVNNPALPISPIMAEVIRESDVGPEVAYHLGTNPQEASRIAALPQHRQAAELGKLEATLTAPKAPAPTRTPPPPPPQTVAGLSAGLAKSPDDMSMTEYIAARNAGQI